MAHTKHIQAHYAPDARAWWAESDDLPGLVSEAPTLDALMDRVAAVVPELLAEGGAQGGAQESGAQPGPGGFLLAWNLRRG